MTALPKKSDKLERLEVRLNAERKELFTRAAKLRGVSLTALVISELESASARIIREHEIIQLSKQDQHAFANALLNPPKPSSKLLRAAKQQKKTVESR